MTYWADWADRADMGFHLYKSKLGILYSFDNIKRSWSGRESNPDLCWTLLLTLNITYSPSTMRSRRHKEKVKLIALCYRLFVWNHENIKLEEIMNYTYQKIHPAAKSL